MVDASSPSRSSASRCPSTTARERAASGGFTPPAATGGERECARGGAASGLYPPEVTNMLASRTEAYRRLLYGGLGFVSLLALALRVEALAALAAGGFALLLVAWREARGRLAGLTVS